jgi:hypothetical protein
LPYVLISDFLPSTFFIFDMYKDFCHHGTMGNGGDGIPVTCRSHPKATQRHLSSLDPGHRVFGRDLSVSLNLCKRKKKRQGSQDFFAVTAEKSSSASGEIRFSTWSLHYQFITLVCRGSFKVLRWTWASEPEPFHLSLVDVAVSVLPDFASHSLTKLVRPVLGNKVHISFHSWSRRS